MNVVDATCKHCGKAFRWLSMTPMYCPQCMADMHSTRIKNAGQPPSVVQGVIYADKVA